MFKMLKCRLIHISHNGICRRFYIQKVKYTLDIFAIRSYNKSDVFIERNSIMAVNQSIYPTFAQVKELPFYLTGIGGSEYQGKYHALRDICGTRYFTAQRARESCALMTRPLPYPRADGSSCLRTIPMNIIP